MTFDEWITLAGLTNAEVAQRMNKLRHILTARQKVETPMADEHRVSRRRLGRRKITPGEILLVERLTDGLVTEKDWQKSEPAPPAPRGNHRRVVHGVWIVHHNGNPMTGTARLLRDEAWQAAGFKVPVDAVAAKGKGYECKLVSRITPTKEMRRAARATG